MMVFLEEVEEVGAMAGVGIRRNPSDPTRQISITDCAALCAGPELWQQQCNAMAKSMGQPQGSFSLFLSRFLSVSLSVSLSVCMTRATKIESIFVHLVIITGSLVYVGSAELCCLPPGDLHPHPHPSMPVQ